MRGGLVDVWPETWRDIWSPLGAMAEVADDFFAEIYGELTEPPRLPNAPVFAAEAYDAEGKVTGAENVALKEEYDRLLSQYQYNQATYNEAISGVNSGKALQEFLLVNVLSEAEAIELLASINDAIESMDNPKLREGYHELVRLFLEKFNLRYELRSPFTLHPTPTGVYATLVESIESQCVQDAGLRKLLRDYREAFQDLTMGRTAGRINTCIQKQVNLLEGLASVNGTVTQDTFGKMCSEIKSWPNSLVSDVAKSLYWFACDHTGIRHGTIKAENGVTRRKSKKDEGAPVAYRDVDMRDLIAMSALLTGLTAYLSDKIDPDAIYGGK